MDPKTIELMKNFGGLLAMLAPWILLFLAIFRDDLKDILLRPKLILDIPNQLKTGERTVLRYSNGSEDLPCVYFHIRAKNKRRRRVASEALLIVERLEVIPDDGQVSRSFLDDLSIKQRHCDKRTATDIGYNHVYYDLFRITENGCLEILLAPPVPNNLICRLDGPGKIELDLSMIAINGKSKTKKLRIVWDGDADIGNTEAHISVDEV